jgi:cysteine synthase A
MQGWSPDFISALTQNALDGGLVDEIIPVGGDDAMKLSKALARKEGIFAGTTSGATLSVALEIAGRSQPGTNIVCMLPDTGERYMSTPLFDHIGEEMTDEEIAISRSTPGCRFDAPQQPAPDPDASAAAEAPVAPDVPAAVAGLDPEIERFVDDVVQSEGVVLFALEWCEFCWSVRKLFARLGIEYRSIDLDSVEYQRNNRGGKIREVLAARTGARTIPQIFVAGQHIGGCTETFDGWRNGLIPRLLDAGSIGYRRSVDIDPYSLLPKWLQPRMSA